jgi:Kef-type K+ transport system membrane component KefB
VHEQHLLADIGLAIIGAGLMGLLAYFARLPLLLAYIAAGALLGPHLGFGLIRDAESISTIAEIGLVLLLFILGLEIDLRRLLQAGKAVLLNGVVQFLGCALLALGFFAALGYGRGGGRFDLVYLAVACSLSSTLVVVKILSDRLELESLTSRITIGVLVIQDLWAISFLAVQPNLAQLKPALLLRSLGSVAVLVGVAWGLARYALPGLFRRAGKVPELMLILAMSWAFAMCGLADQLHLSMEMGALVAGVAIASFPYQTDVAAKVSSLRDFFITLFFVALGLQIPVPTAPVLKLALAVFAFVQLSRLLTVFPVLYGLRYGNRASLVPALNLAQLSEFALVLASLGFGLGHVSQDLVAAFIFALVATAFVSALVIPRTHQAYRWLNPRLERLGLRDKVSAAGADAAGAHAPARIVLLGFFREASSLLHEMMAKHSAKTLQELMVVDFNPEAHHRLKEMGVRCEYGDISHAETLMHLHLEHAQLLVCTIPDHLFKGTSNLSLLKTLKKLAPKARIVVAAETFDSAREMYHEGADYVFLPRVIASHYLADVLNRMQAGSATAIREGAASYLAKRQEVLP